jgi:hypothetical protein
MSVPLLMAHVGGCPRREQGHTDAARRVADACILQWVAGKYDTVGKWLAFKLEDGRSDNVLYDSKRDVVRHQKHGEMSRMYVKIHPGGMNPCEAEAMLRYTRQAYLNGFRLPDPDSKTGGPDLIPRIGMEKVRAQISALTNGGRK